MTLLFYSLVDDAADWTACLRAADPALDVRVWPDCPDPSAVDAVLAWKAPPGFYARFPNLKLIVNLGAGVDYIVADGTLPAGVPITRISEPGMAQMMANYVLAVVLRHFRELGAFERAQRERRWHYIHPREARLCTVGVMGLGNLGGEVAQALVAQGFTVIGWSRTAKSIAGIDTFAGLDSLATFLGRCEICVALLPRTRETDGLMDAERFAQLPRGAKFVNIGRGSLVDDAALVAALESGHISEATLDVFREEPLPADHPYWGFPQVLITPHLASVAVPRTAAEQVVANLRRVGRGEAPLNQVDPERGY